MTITRRAPVVPRTTGSAAGVLAVSLLAFSVVGALWGVLRPAHTGTLAEGGQVFIDGAFNVEFTSFITFVAATGLLATIVSLCVYVASPGTRGPGMLWWLTFVALVSALSFLQVGFWTTSLVNPLPDPDVLSQGTKVTLVPGFTPGIGLAAAPFMAALTYWCSALVTPEQEPGPASIE